MVIEVPASGGLSRRFLQSAAIDEADADAMAEEIATALGLDWQM